MQHQPDAARLLEVVGKVVEECVPLVPDEHRHRLRVASSLLAILHREAVLGADVLKAEVEALARLVGDDGTADAAHLSRRLVERLRGGHDPGFERETWSALVETTRRDLSIARPGHERWTGG